MKCKYCKKEIKGFFPELDPTLCELHARLDNIIRCYSDKNIFTYMGKKEPRTIKKIAGTGHAISAFVVGCGLIATMTIVAGIASPVSANYTPGMIVGKNPYNAIEYEIMDVFGNDWRKALLLLRGVGNCAENRNLDPRAVNDNRTWGGVGVDRGIFQINSVYHPLTEAQAFDYKQNIRYAHRMFHNDNGTFAKRWTAGKCLRKMGYDI